MINISQEEFESKIEMLINGKITKVKLAKELKTDIRTLDFRIQEMSVSNPELYESYISVLPYKQKGYDHIDFEALVIHMLKKGMNVETAAKQYGISPRTIRRRINSLENTKLTELYKEVAENSKRGREDSLYVIQMIESLEERDIVLGDINDSRETELLRIEAEFNRLCAQGMSKTEAAKAMGYSDRDRTYKLLNELYRLEIEKNTKEKLTKEQQFRESYKVGERSDTATEENIGSEKQVIEQDVIAPQQEEETEK